ncbi:MAG: hypothetical protein ABI613_04910 [Gemmatimonadota bacterium]
MTREDDARLSLREMSRWLVPLAMVILGLVLFFLLRNRTSDMASPVHVETDTP